MSAQGKGTRTRRSSGTCSRAQLKQKMALIGRRLPQYQPVATSLVQLGKKRDSLVLSRITLLRPGKHDDHCFRSVQSNLNNEIGAVAAAGRNGVDFMVKSVELLQQRSVFVIIFASSPIPSRDKYTSTTNLAHVPSSYKISANSALALLSMSSTGYIYLEFVYYTAN